MGAATLSASFATYMVVVGPGHVGVQTAADFGVLAHLGPRTMPADSRVTPLLQGSSEGGRTLASADARPAPAAQGAGSVDFAPTGSVEHEAGQAAQGDAPTLRDFILRDVFDGKALVETRSSLTLVSPGTVLDGAGEVLAIRKQGEGWVVATSKGVIVSPAR